MTDDVIQKKAALTTSVDVDGLLAPHIEAYFDSNRIADLKTEFASEHIVPLRGLCPESLHLPIKDEACRLIDDHGLTHDLVFEVTDGTPRNLTTVGQPVIKDEGPLIHSFYFSQSLRRLLTSVVGEELHTCPYEGEHYVVSRLGRSGDTHGWHWDDYTYGLILVLEAPHYTDGGFVQAVPNTSWDKENPDVHHALLSSRVRSCALEAGDAYIIKTNTTMHRVYPIRGNSRRTIINMTLASTEDLTRPMTHETNDVLFGGAAPGSDIVGNGASV